MFYNHNGELKTHDNFVRTVGTDHTGHLQTGTVSRAC